VLDERRRLGSAQRSPADLALQCKGTDQASAALVMDLKQRGLQEDTQVVWGGEFGRTVSGERAAPEASATAPPNPFAAGRGTIRVLWQN